MSNLTRDNILLEEWKTAEGTIRNLDTILTNIRFYGSTAVIALMGAAAESIRSTDAIIRMFTLSLHVSFLIQVLSSILVLILWALHSQYVAFLKEAVDRQRKIEADLRIGGEEVLHLGRDITRAHLPRYLHNPWKAMFIALLTWSILLAVAYLARTLPDCR